MNIQIKIEYNGKEYLSDKDSCTAKVYDEVQKTMGNAVCGSLEFLIITSQGNETFLGTEILKQSIITIIKSE